VVDGNELPMYASEDDGIVAETIKYIEERLKLIASKTASTSTQMNALMVAVELGAEYFKLIKDMEGSDKMLDTLNERIDKYLGYIE